MLNSIKKIPIKIGRKLIKHLNLNYHKTNIIIVGYKVIQSKYKVPIIELSNYSRIWILNQELLIPLKLNKKQIEK
uniref:Cytochrome b6-f complex subunit PetP n=1 Tax=Halydictyon mirabile TaxID=189652 RepID=A0A4D6WW38_9FLOR|nr:cytochrome b6-f complex subunit PetP [Halydictyon mirabile]